MRNPLFALMRANVGRGSFRAETATNTLYLYDFLVSSAADAEWMGGVDAETFARSLAAMQGDVTVRISSPGGDVFAGIAMANAIAAYPGKVTCIVDGWAASAASVVAAAGDRIEMAPGALLMIHCAWTIAVGNAEEFMAQAAVLEKIDGQLAKGYAAAAARHGMTTGEAEFAALMAAETWLAADEAIALGLADAVAPAAIKAQAPAFDLSAYPKAPTATTTVSVTVTIDDDSAETADPAEDPLVDPSTIPAPDMPDAATRLQAQQRTNLLRLLTTV